ncbi:MAG TPA: M67 family metallopeptidase [Symbiobacteriaceae bacterium]
MFWLFGKRKSTTPLFGPGKLHIPETLYRRMINHCNEERPLEACGLLMGQGGQTLSAYATDNQHRSPVIYKVDEHQLLEALHDIRSEQHGLIGIYHSHVKTAPVPSRTDIGQAYWPEVFYVIVSLAHRRPQVRAWRIVDGHVTEHQVVIQKLASGKWHDLRRAVRPRQAPDAARDIP